MTSLKEQNKVPVTDPKEIEICELPDKELKTIILKKLIELSENTDKQLDKIRKSNT